MQRSSGELWDQADIIQTQHRYALGIDRRDWALYRSVFADRVCFDFTSWYGGIPVELSADDWVARVAARQSGFDATQHQMSNHSVTLNGVSAECVTYIIARHVLISGSFQRIQSIGGYYTNELSSADSGWKITRCKLTVQWSEGDRGLFEEAAERVRKGTVPPPPTDRVPD